MRNTLFGLILALPLAACSGNDQVLTGHVTTGFPQAITGVRVMQGSAVVASSPLAADGSFQLHVPAGSGLSLELMSAGGHDAIVFPRVTGAIDRTFSIRAGGGDFDLGAIRFVGDSSMARFAFHGDNSSSDCDDSGHDSMGAMCCDDGGDGGGDDNGTCEGSGSDAGSGSGSGSGSGGTVIPFAADGGGSDDGSGSDGSGSGSDNDDGTDNGDGVCEHDMPTDCGGGEGSGSGEHGGGGQEADLPYDVKPQLGATATPILDAFTAEGKGLPTAITNVTMDAPSWRLAELQASTPFVVTSDDCNHIGNTGSVGRDRVFVTWTNPDGSTMIDHLDIEYCQQ